MFCRGTDEQRGTPSLLFSGPTASCSYTHPIYGSQQLPAATLTHSLTLTLHTEQLQLSCSSHSVIKRRVHKGPALVFTPPQPTLSSTLMIKTETSVHFQQTCGATFRRTHACPLKANHTISNIYTYTPSCFVTYILGVLP